MAVDFVVFKRRGVRLPACVATLGYLRMSLVWPGPMKGGTTVIAP